MDCSPLGSSVHRVFQARILKRVAISFSKDLPDPGIEPALLKSPALAGRFFTTSTTWEVLIFTIIVAKWWSSTSIFLSIFISWYFIARKRFYIFPLYWCIFIKVGVWVLNLFSGTQSISILIYFVIQTVLNLAIGNAFKLDPVSFWCVPIILWGHWAFSSTRYSRLVLYIFWLSLEMKHFFWGALGPFNEECYFETKIWMLGTVVVILLLLESFSLLIQWLILTFSFSIFVTPFCNSEKPASHYPQIFADASTSSHI